MVELPGIADEIIQISEAGHEEEAWVDISLEKRRIKEKGEEIRQLLETGNREEASAKIDEIKKDLYSTIGRLEKERKHTDLLINALMAEKNRRSREARKKIRKKLKNNK